RLFSTFSYTGEGAGGGEDKLAAGVLAYTDDALLYLDQIPDCLAGASLIRTANADRNYWANDYIVAISACELDLFVAHDNVAPRPEWLAGFRPHAGAVEVNGHKLSLFVQRLKSGSSIQISGNQDRAQVAGKAYNLILFARRVSASPATTQTLAPSL
ncbi:MAG: hypothetical protein RLY20_1628, partial [Verrucomicrobiota bacterium]